MEFFHFLCRRIDSITPVFRSHIVTQNSSKFCTESVSGIVGGAQKDKRCQKQPVKKTSIAKSKSRAELFTTWVSLKDSELKTAILIRQAESTLNSRMHLPRHLSILPACISFWKNAYPDWAKALENLDEDIMLDYMEGSRPYELTRFLFDIYGSNSKLDTLADVSTASGEVGQFLRICNSLRRDAKTSGYLIASSVVVQPKIYETLIRHFSEKADWLSLDGLLKRMEQDGFRGSTNSYLYGIECLGRLLEKLESGSGVMQPFSSFGYSITSKAVYKKLVGTRTEAIQHVKKLLYNLVARAEAENLQLTDGLLDVPRRNNSFRFLIAGLRAAYNNQKELDANEFARNLAYKDDECVHPVQRHLLSVPHRKLNPFSNTMTTPDLLKAFQRQFAIEKKGMVHIPPILPPFPNPETVDDNCVTSRRRDILPKALRQSLATALLEEQSQWRKKLTVGFKELLQRVKRSHSRDRITVYPFLKILPASQYIDLMINAVDSMALDSTLQHVSSHVVCLKLGQQVESACNLYRKEKLGILTEFKEVYSEYVKQFNVQSMLLDHFRHMWQQILLSRISEGGVSLDQNWPEWTISAHIMVGRALYGLIYERLTFNRLGLTSARQNFLNPPSKPTFLTKSSAAATQNRQEAPVLFEVLTEYPQEMRTEVKMHPTLTAWYRDAEYPPLCFHPAELPMQCPPVPWINVKDAGYLISRNYATRLMRHSHASPVADPALDDDLDFDAKRIPAVLDALNCLAACPWRVNEPILDDLISVGRSGGNRKLSIPEWSRLAAPSSFCITNAMTYEERRAARRQAWEAQKHYDESKALWASELYRLSIANHYRGQVFWLPHSMDFRGRVYPCPPHFHHMGSDVSRGLILFAKGVPLGNEGLKWLKIHLINLTGLHKRSSNAERLEFAETLLDEVVDSAKNPFTGRGWWQAQEEPWQVLACCRELDAALHHPVSQGGPESFVSHFPVHQDGSCNGLQHYAALGRDRTGAESVNLTSMQVPQDVYSDVVAIVEAQRRRDSANGVAVAQVLEGFVSRKVIKQSVMTTVYGVTLYGASAQIRRQLKELDGFPSREWIGPAAAYLARLTLSSIGKIFTSSVEFQTWAGQLCHYIGRHLGSRVSWVTPLGLPVVQPYMQLTSSIDRKPSHWWTTDIYQPFSPPVAIPSNTVAMGTGGAPVTTPSRSLLARSSQTHTIDLPVPNVMKQRNAFPPNFIHSLDSCHMMLTALHCLRAGITFASVHDCFWTHAASVDEMNRICREEFIALHSEPILENFADYIRAKFSYTHSELDTMTCESRRARALAFNELLLRVPKPGSFDLSEVRDSTYFFS